VLITEKNNIFPSRCIWFWTWSKNIVDVSTCLWI